MFAPVRDVASTAAFGSAGLSGVLGRGGMGSGLSFSGELAGENEVRYTLPISSRTAAVAPSARAHLQSGPLVVRR
jgi:hypothetical protein